MKKLFNISHPLIALLLAVAVINIYVTDSYCSFKKEAEHNPVASVSSKTEKNHHQHTYPAAHGQKHGALGSHHHDKQDAEEHHHTGTKDADHSKSEDKDDNCCKDNSSQFFSSLTNPSIHYVTEILPVAVNISHTCLLTEPFPFDKFSSSPEYLLFRPPPNIPDIRVFIQSFII